MATLLNKPLRRELPIDIDRQTYIVELHGWGIRLRPKRRRIAYEISWDSIHNRAAMIAAQQLIADRKAARIAKRKGAKA